MNFRTLILAMAAALVAAGPALGQAGEEQSKPAVEAGPAYALVTTSKGAIVLELDAVKAPKSVANFLAYVDTSYYDGTIFHRVIDGFMVQGGGFTKDMEKKPAQPPIENEWRNGLKNARGTVAMARLGGRPDSATSQFFINVVDNEFLDRPQADGAAYAVFGRVVVGIEVVDAIKGVETKTVGPYRDVPVEPVIIEKISRMSEEDAKKRMEQAKSDDA